MSNFAIIVNNKIQDVFVSDESAVLEAMFPKALVVEETEATDIAFVGGDYLEGKFIPPQPYPSWEYKSETNSWFPPIDYPIEGGAYSWNEDELAWELIG